MPRVHRPLVVSLATVGLALAAFLVAGLPTGGGLVLAADPGLKFNGPSACSAQACHGSARAKGEGRTVHNEYTLWLKNDRHAKSFAVLSRPLGVRIGQRMGLKEPSEKSDRCLKCHVAFVPKELQLPSYDVAAGNSCDDCHGPSEKWLEPHSRSSDKYKDWTRAQSLQQGMIDTLDPAERANMCVKCHLQIDHDMIDAGHPYMTFELDNFQTNLPPHWQKEKPFVATKCWAAGQAVALRDALKQLHFRVTNKAPENHVADALIQALAYYVTVRRAAQVVAPEPLKPIDAELTWLVTGQDANPEKVAKAADPGFQNALFDLGKKLGSHEWGPEQNLNLLKSFAAAGQDVDNIGFKAAEQVFYAIDSLYRPYSKVANPANKKDVEKIIGRLQDAVLESGKFKVEEFNGVLKEFGATLK